MDPLSDENTWTEYTDPIELTPSPNPQILRAKAYSGAASSDLSQTSFNVFDSSLTGMIELPDITPPGGTYFNDVMVTVDGHTNPPFKIRQLHITTDGNDPAPYSNTGSGVSSPSVVAVTSSTTVKALAAQLGCANSEIVTNDYVLQCAKPDVSAVPILDGSATITLDTATTNATIRYTTDMSEVTPASTEYTGPFVFGPDMYTLKAKCFRTGYVDSETLSLDINPVPECDGKAATHFVTSGVPFVGTPGDDVIVGTVGADVIDGAGGNDLICARAGADVVLGGPGDDTLYGESGADEMNGQSGNDRMFGGDQADLMFGSLGNDFMVGGLGWDTMQGNAGVDTMNGQAGNDNINGGDGDDVLFGADAHDLINGGRGADSITAGSGNDRVNGQNDDDLINANDGHDQIWGSFGNDRIDGGNGFDAIFGGWGDDHLNGAGSSDRIWGEGGHDTLLGDWGADILNGGFGFDTCDGGFGVDVAAECETQLAIP